MRSFANYHVGNTVYVGIGLASLVFPLPPDQHPPLPISSLAPFVLLWSLSLRSLLSILLTKTLLGSLRILFRSNSSYYHCCRYRYMVFVVS